MDLIMPFSSFMCGKNSNSVVWEKRFMVRCVLRDFWGYGHKELGLRLHR